jgi:hypothetical protein
MHRIVYKIRKSNYLWIYKLKGGHCIKFDNSINNVAQADCTETFRSTYILRFLKQPAFNANLYDQLTVSSKKDHFDNMTRKNTTASTFCSPPKQRCEQELYRSINT